MMKEVKIVLDSDSMGDVLSWIPYVDKFQKITNSKVNVLSPFSELFNFFYTENNEICLGTYSEEENMGISELLSSDVSALDKFIEKKLKESVHSLDEKNKLNINLNPKKDDVISKGQGALVLK